MKRLYAIGLTCLFSLQTSLLAAQDENHLRLLAEPLSPFTYIENDQPKGYMLDLFMKISERSGLPRKPEDVEFMTWARAYHFLENEKNTGILAMSMTPERESLFQFIGPIPGAPIGIIMPKEAAYKINGPEDLAALPGIGVVRDDIGEQRLTRQHPELNNLYQTSNAESVIRMLNSNRVPAISMGWMPFMMQSQKMGLNPDDFTVAYTLSVSRSGMAFHKDTSSELIERMQAALNELTEEGYVANLRKQYLPGE